MSAISVIKELKTLANPKRVQALQYFYRTAPGEYGEGDIFIGVSVPKTRSVAALHKELSIPEIEKLLASPIHEIRLCGLIILVNQYKRLKSSGHKKKLFNFYIAQLKLKRVNSWDLIDVSAPTFGSFLIEVENPMALLTKLAKSKSLWERRASILLTFAFVRDGRMEETVLISKLLIKDEHDLIHKAVGWMLRELGKRDPILLRKFLKTHSSQMPRTMLRYAIEKLPEKERKYWLLSSKH